MQSLLGWSPVRYLPRPAHGGKRLLGKKVVHMAGRGRRAGVRREFGQPRRELWRRERKTSVASAAALWKH